MMIRKVTLSVLTVFIFTSIYAQKDPEVKNIDLDVENNKVVINYDLISPESAPQGISLYFLDKAYNVVKPNSISGDFGKNITPGRKTIVWDIAQDKTELSRKIRPQIVLSDYQNRLGGPNNMFLSLLVPGLGDYFVKDPSDMTIKPYMRTIATLGMIGLGIKASQVRDEVPLTSLQEERYWNSTDRKWDTRFIEVQHGVKTEYWLFKNDAELFIAAGAAMWIADIIWVAAEGRVNSKVRHIYSNLDMGVNRFGGMNFAYKIKF